MRCVLVRFGSVLPRIPPPPPPPPESLVLSLSGLPAVVVASRVAGVRTILMQVVAPRADAVRFSAFWVRAPQDTPPPPPRNPWFCRYRACQLFLSDTQVLGRADSGEGADGLATRSRMSRQGCARRETSRAARRDQMGHPKAARRSHSQMLRNSRSESFDRVTTLVDFGAHFLWSPPHSLQRACAADRLRKV